MKLNRMFRWIWRFNALMFAVCSLVFISIAAVAFYPTARDFLRRKPAYHASDMVNVEENTKIDSEWKLGGFSQISNTSFMMSPVYSKQEYEYGYGGKETSATRNYFFLNSDDKTTRWLVPSNKFLFVDDGIIKESKDENSKVTALRYKLVKADTNNDNRLTAADKQTFAISDVDGSNFTEIVGGIDESLGEERPNADTILLFYRSDAKNFLTEIKISAKKAIQTKELPKING